eukprot:m.92774 g.92774  ORF g.92774 m.92774 type:complete len:1268 (+) comp15075_c0_seq1:118-3921(+)
MSEGESEVVILFVSFALFLGCLVRHATQQWLHVGVPYTVILLVLGCALGGLAEAGLAKLGEAVQLVSEIEPGLFLAIFLPPIIFESAFSLSFHKFAHSFVQVVILALPGVLFQTAIAGCFIRFVVQPDWSWAESLLLGSLLSATDPVAVVALLKDLGASAKLGTLIEGESLVNDGSAIVLFTVLIDIVRGEDPNAGAVAETFFQLALGGPALGLAWAFVTIYWLSRIVNDPFIEITLTFCTTYLLFFVAEDAAEVSGVLAVVTFGLCFAAFGNTQVSPQVEHQLHSFWELTSFMANTLLFVYAGVIIVQRVRLDFPVAEYAKAVGVWAFLVALRSLTIFLLFPFLKGRWVRGYPISKSQAVVLAWGGLRGAVALALALIVALDAGRIDDDIREIVLFYTAWVVILSLTVNATLTKPLLQYLKLTNPTVFDVKFFHSTSHSLDRLSRDKMVQLSRQKLFAGCNWDVVQALWDSPFYHEKRNCYLTSATMGPDMISTASDENNVTIINEDFERLTSGEIDVAPLEANIRRRFLSCTKYLYWEQFQTGYLPGAGVSVLIQAAETAEDHATQPLAEWEVSLRKYCQRSEASISLNERYGTSALSVAINVVTSFIHAQKRSFNSVQRWVKGVEFEGFERDCRGDLEEFINRESSRNIAQARKWLHSIYEHHPRIVCQTRSRLAASLILQDRRDRVEELGLEGLLTTSEAALLMSTIHQAETQLSLGDLKVPMPSVVAIARSCWLFEGVSNELFMELQSGAKEIVVQESGQTVLQKSLVPEHLGVFIVVSGFALFSLKHKGGNVDMLGMGQTFGVIETVAQCPSILTVTAHTSPLVLMFFPGDKLREAARDSPRLRRNLNYICGFQLAYVFWPQLKAKLGHSIGEHVFKHDVEERVKQFDTHQFFEGDTVRLTFVSILVTGKLRRDGSQQELFPFSVLSPRVEYEAVQDGTLFEFPLLKPERRLTRGTTIKPGKRQGVQATGRPAHRRRASEVVLRPDELALPSELSLPEESSVVATSLKLPSDMDDAVGMQGATDLSTYAEALDHRTHTTGAGAGRVVRSSLGSLGSHGSSQESSTQSPLQFGGQQPSLTVPDAGDGLELSDDDESSGPTQAAAAIWLGDDDDFSAEQQHRVPPLPTGRQALESPPAATFRLRTHHEFVDGEEIELVPLAGGQGNETEPPTPQPQHMHLADASGRRLSLTITNHTDDEQGDDDTSQAGGVTPPLPDQATDTLPPRTAQQEQETASHTGQQETAPHTGQQDTLLYPDTQQSEV